MAEPVAEPRLVDAPVLVVGTGLLGTSIALALQPHCRTLLLTDADPATAREAAARGAGRVLDESAGGPAPALVVLAVPPSAVAGELRRWQRRWPAAVCTDVSSAQVLPQAQARALGCDLTRYVGGHPMAGSERCGPAAARADLFVDRPWVLLPLPEASDAALARVRELAELCGARPVLRDAEEHDRAVALVSHAPQLVASLLAARLADAPADALALAGQGLRDTTRIAGSSPELWVDILRANAGPVADVLTDLAADLDATIATLRALQSQTLDPGDAAALGQALRRGQTGRSRLTGSPARAPSTTEQVPVGPHGGQREHDGERPAGCQA